MHAAVRLPVLAMAVLAMTACSGTGGGVQESKEPAPTLTPSREGWLEGIKGAPCYAVSDKPVKGLMKATGRP
jgi:hypothetical protein